MTRIMSLYWKRAGHAKLSTTPHCTHTNVVTFTQNLFNTGNDFELFLRHNTRGDNWYYKSTSLSVSVSSQSKPARRTVGSVKAVQYPDDNRHRTRAITHRPPTHTPPSGKLYKHTAQDNISRKSYHSTSLHCIAWIHFSLPLFCNCELYTWWDWGKCWDKWAYYTDHNLFSVGLS